MDEYYLQIRNVHIASVIASGSLFFLRGFALNVLGVRWVMATPVNFLSYAIDTVLLTAALMLMSIVKQYPFVDGWLTAKVLLLAVYVVLGGFALKRSKTRKTRLVYWAAALAVFAFIFSIARAHNPMGFLAGLQL
jgi:uncharacterized membrane protein SirB2